MGFIYLPSEQDVRRLFIQASILPLDCTVTDVGGSPANPGVRLWVASECCATARPGLSPNVHTRRHNRASGPLLSHKVRWQ